MLAVPMIERNPGKTIAFGFILVLAGFVTSILMVIGILAASFTLSFLAYAASLSGLLIGILGVAAHRRKY
jgi:putative Mn2+ efflux pump MntP